MEQRTNDKTAAVANGDKQNAQMIANGHRQHANNSHVVHLCKHLAFEPNERERESCNSR